MEKSSKFQTFENLFKNSITAKERSLKLRLHELILANVRIFTPLKTLEHQRFSGIFKGFEKQTMAKMGEDF